MRNAINSAALLQLHSKYTQQMYHMCAHIADSGFSKVQALDMSKYSLNLHTPCA